LNILLGATVCYFLKVFLAFKEIIVWLTPHV